MSLHPYCTGKQKRIPITSHHHIYLPTSVCIHLLIFCFFSSCYRWTKLTTSDPISSSGTTQGQGQCNSQKILSSLPWIITLLHQNPYFSLWLMFIFFLFLNSEASQKCCWYSLLNHFNQTLMFATLFILNISKSLWPPCHLLILILSDLLVVYDICDHSFHLETLFPFPLGFTPISLDAPPRLICWFLLSMSLKYWVPRSFFLELFSEIFQCLGYKK